MMNRFDHALYSLVCTAAAFACPVLAADWPTFRGPTGDGISTEESVPIKWSATENIKWSVPLPTPSNGSPIVSHGSVFLVTAQDDGGLERTLYCFDRSDGDLRWQQTVAHARKMPTHKTNPYCGSTPAADGQRVVVWHGSGGLYCYDFDGHELWARDLGEFEHMWGYGTSPVLFRDSVIMHCSPGKRNFLTALDLETGKTIWEIDEPYQGDGDRREDGSYMGSWATPVLVQVDGQEQLVCALPTRVAAYNPIDGTRIWWCDGIRGPKGDLAYSSPIIAGDLCVVFGGFNGPSIGLRYGGRQNITDSRRVWRRESKNPQSIGTAVHVQGYLYRPNAGPGTIDCIDPRSGDVLWSERGTGKSHWASIVYAAGFCFATDQDGATLVFRPNPEKCEIISTNRLEDPTNSTPAISDGELFIRTSGALFCIKQSS